MCWRRLSVTESSSKPGGASQPARGGLGWLPWRKQQQQAIDVEPQFRLCPFCRLRADVERRLVHTLVEQLQREEIRAGLRQSTGLCLQHFTMARQYAGSDHPEQLSSLLECQETCMQRVLNEVEELIRKHDYRFEDESHGDEMTAWRRAAQLSAGNPGVL